MTVRALFLLAVSFLAVVLPSVEARAQTATVTLDPAVPTRRTGRSQTLDTKLINYDDCMADDTITVSYKVVGTGVSLEVWVGETAMCSDYATRMLNGNIPGSCWQVYNQTAAETATVPLRVRDILKHGASGKDTGDESVCKLRAMDGTGSGTYTVYFTPVNGNANGGTAATLSIKFDLQGPVPPTVDANVLPGDTRLFPTWKASTTATSDTAEYYLYCEEAATTAPCTAATLVAGEPPPTDSPLKRGQTSINTTSGEASGLTNGTTYACGVAGYDKDGNLGNLSELACGVPEIVDGYFKQYRAAGGTAGGGYCSFGRTAGTPAGAAASLAALAWLSVRRRTRRKS